MLTLQNITHVYNKGTVYETTVLNQINFSVKDFERVCVIGKPGSGKTTLVQYCTGLLTPNNSNSEIHLDNEKITAKNINKLREQIGLVFQYPEHQFFEATVFDEIAFGLRIRNAADVDEKVNEISKAIGLNENLFDKNPFELSGGEQRKVALASVLITKPRILFLDEPTVGLDYKSRRELHEYISKLDCSIVIISHDIDFVFDVADRVIILEHGKSFDVPLNELQTTTKRFANLLKTNGIQIPNTVITFENMIDFLISTLTNAK